MEQVPTIDGLDATWLALRLGLESAASMTSVAVGSGQVANCYRLEVVASDGSVASTIAKVPSSDEVSRTTASAQHLYLREVSFYQHLATDIATRTPRCYFASRDEDDNFLLLLEDLSPAVAVDQFSGITTAMARCGLDALAGLHGPTHRRSDLHSAPWLGGVGESLGPLYAAVLPVLFERFLERYDHRINEVTRTTVNALKERLALYSRYVSAHPCVTHGDFRTDNLLFDARGGDVAVAVVDWQTIGVASPMLDVAYFLTTSLSPEDCERYDVELLEYYLEQLGQFGVAYEPEVARHEYARYTLQPIVMLVAASVIVEQTDRGDQMFLTMIERGVLAATRWRALEEVERHAAGQ